ncbi:unnamed protein product, partial [marine sediment metagenome]
IFKEHIQEFADTYEQGLFPYVWTVPSGTYQEEYPNR